MTRLSQFIPHGRKCYRQLAVIVVVTLVIIHLNLFSSSQAGNLPLLRANGLPMASIPVFKSLNDTTKNTTVTLVVSSTSSEHTEWVTKNFPNVNSAVYVVDATDPKEQFKPPMNKGNEAMVYLTYIIDYYDILPDVAIFSHAHLLSEHTDDLLGGSIIETLQRLRLPKVAQDGYFNMRCNWEPGGCPQYLNLHDPDRSTKDGAKQAQILIDSWAQLFPQMKSVGEWVGQPYGGQFAASRDAIRRVPLHEWRRWRDWLMKTELNDYHSGRVWEYTWQYVLNGSSIFCPNMYDCYCEGYGVCFESEQDMQNWRSKEQQLQDFIMECLKMKPAVQKAIELKQIAAQKKEELDRLLEMAKDRGDRLFGNK